MTAMRTSRPLQHMGSKAAACLSVSGHHDIFRAAVFLGLCPRHLWWLPRSISRTMKSAGALRLVTGLSLGSPTGHIFQVPRSLSLFVKYSGEREGPRPSLCHMYRPA